MIDLDDELARMERLLERRERMALGVTCNEMIELITRLRQAEKDAARYLWLRDECRHEYVVDDLFDGHSDLIDKRIDAAMIEE